MEPITTQPSRYEVFVSYSSEDYLYAKEFLSHLTLPFKKGELFFDENNLYAGDDFDKVILPALDASRVVVLLVSSNSLKDDGYCWKHEIPRAVSANKTIIPVIIMDCHWDLKEIAGFPGKKLDKKLAIPSIKKRSRALTAVTEGADSPAARAPRWKECVTEIVRTCRPDATTHSKSQSAANVPSIAHRPISSRRDPLFWSLCDQKDARDAFRLSLKAGFSGKSLFILVQGCDDDKLPDFWQRVSRYELTTWIGKAFDIADKPCVHRLTPVEKADSYSQRVKRFWGSIRQTRQFAAQELSRQLQVLKDLHLSLVGHVHPAAEHDSGLSDESQKAAIMESVATYLGTLPSRLAVECPLGKSHHDAISSIKALAEVLASMPDSTRLDRLVFGFRWMGAGDLAESFREAVTAASGGRCHPVGFPHLAAFGKTEVEEWFNEGLKEGNLKSADKQKLIEHAFKNQEPEIRFRHLYSAYVQL